MTWWTLATLAVGILLLAASAVGANADRIPDRHLDEALRFVHTALSLAVLHVVITVVLLAT